MATKLTGGNQQLIDFLQSLSPLDDEIIGAAENACPDPDGTVDSDRMRYPSPSLANYVLEVPAGWMAEHGYGPGTQIALPEGL